LCSFEETITDLNSIKKMQYLAEKEMKEVVEMEVKKRVILRKVHFGKVKSL
jgi:hypothetical protein